MIGNLCVFGVYVRRETGALFFRLLSFVLIFLSLFVLYKAAAPLSQSPALVTTSTAMALTISPVVLHAWLHLKIAWST